MAATNSLNMDTTGVQTYNATTGGLDGSTTTDHAVIVGTTNNKISNVGPSATAGQILQSGGASADPAYSTATYPSTATGTGKILRANGTNWVATTATYPDTAGSSGNVLTSDGTNWVSSAPPGGGLLVATGTMTSAQIKALHGTPITAIAAPGAGNVIQVVSFAIKMNYGGTNAFTNGGSAPLVLVYSNLTDVIDSSALTAAMIIATASQLDGGSGTDFATSSTYSSYDNSAVMWYNQSVTEYGGNAANDNTMPYSILYRIVTL